ncbi:MAG: hypothetical protein ED556_01330 [Winogradskyella sp.]|uniref:hypothetical protein n=1 Tax=Winogradskyella sp. TaxID=1883156 RepID=UPI000F3EB93F|nr:hypothetical protein [Winogradskyella sp.]RNC87861.1 MAG: hypothetical protein ED556_01330 [Winogradskyella sp.]
MIKNKKKLSIALTMIFGISFSQQFQNNYCDLDCLEEAFELSEGIIEGYGGHQQAYEHFEIIYDMCTAIFCNQDGSYSNESDNPRN